MKTIDIFPWDDHFDTGIDVIDQQHRKLVAIINELATQVAYSTKIEDLSKIFDELVAYTLYHFATEEEIWNTYIPNDLLKQQHHAGHADFVEKVKSFQIEQQDKSLDLLADEALSFLTNWLAVHILDVDRYMAHVVSGIMKGLNLTEAKHYAKEQMSGSSRVLINIILSIYSTLSTNTIHLLHELKIHKSYEEKVAYQDKYRKLLLELSASFINIPLEKLEVTIQDALEKMAAFVGVNRAYIYDYDPKTDLFSNTYRWHVDDKAMDTLNPVLEDILLRFKTSHHCGDYLCLDNLSSIGINRLIAIPLLQGGVCKGFIGFDSSKKEYKLKQDDIELLTLFGRLLSNVHERRDIEMKLSHERIMLEAILDNAPLGIWMTDIDGKVKFVNKTYCDITGISEEEFLNAEHYTSLFPKEVSSGCLNSDKEVLLCDKKAHSSIETLPMKDGKKRLLEITKVKVLDENGHIGIIGLSTDITERHAQQQHLEYIAHYDTLTKLPNRVLLSDRLNHALAQADRHQNSLAVVYLDLDGFKYINDQYGHESGDLFLSAMAQRLQKTLRKMDTIARLGGDEFVVILPDLKNHSDSIPLLERLLQASSKKIIIKNTELNVSASLGVTFFDAGDKIDADQLLRQADHAMYQAKISGKNRYHIFDLIKDEKIRTNNEQIEEIKTALSQGEFVLYYQPKVNMRSGEVLGVEALIRWNHPQRGLLAPCHFLPVMEGHPLSITLGSWVLETAMQQIEIWKKQGIFMNVSVNIDALQFQNHDIVKELEMLLSSHPLAHNAISLEIRETNALEDIIHVIEVMQACQKLGISFSLDDFGTGYSSLTYLKRLPVKELKIDQTFVCDMLEDTDNFVILNGILGLAKAFHKEIIAEGVESIEHGVMLLRMGCDRAQGYIIAHPMPADEIAQWRETWKPDIRWEKSHALSPEHIPLIQAAMEHRSWISSIKNYLSVPHQQMPVLNHAECDFGTWLYNQGIAQYHDNPHVQKIQEIHNRIHDEVHDIIHKFHSHTLKNIPKKLEYIDQCSRELDDALEEFIESLV
ncbi:bacteriohemerythrin [Sulfurospirillum sp. 1612]|uniref:bacteriohemerythrin n=1 Tax=Sulfurospirillum sp. 1612 TaxID=3094835 RepID=UPI002F9581CA